MKKSKILSLVLTLAMLLSIMAGCTPGDEGTSTTPTPSQSVSTPTPTSSEEANVEEDDAPGLPLVSEPVTYEAWMAAGALSATSGMMSFGESAAWLEAVRRTNVDIIFNHPTTAGQTESFNLLFATDMLPDMIIGGNTQLYVGGIEKYIEDDFLIYLTDLVDEYCPNYSEARKVSDLVYKQTISDYGEITALYTINYTLQPTFLGPVARQDWIDKYGAGQPETYDEWHNMFTLMKDDAGVAPLYLGANTGMDRSLMAGLDAFPEFMQIDGKVMFGPAEQSFRDYVELMAQWFSEGIIDPDFFSRVSVVADYGLFAQGDFGYTLQLYTFIDLIEATSTIEGINVRAVPAPVKNKGDMRYTTVGGATETHQGGGNVTVSSKCENPEIVLRLFDYFYGDEGALLANYGVLDEGFTYVDGSPMLSSLVTKNPDGLSLNDGMNKYTFSSHWPRRYAWEREITDDMSDKAKEAGAIWDANWDLANTHTLPPVTMTAEEQSEYTRLYGDIKTLVEESVANFIIGARPMSEYDAFVNEMWNLGLQKCLDLQQAATDRFYARG